MMLVNVCLYPPTAAWPLTLYLCQIFTSSPPCRSCGKWLSSRWWAACLCTSSSTCADASLPPITPSWPLKLRAVSGFFLFFYLWWQNTKMSFCSSCKSCKSCTWTGGSNPDSRPLTSEKLLKNVTCRWFDRDRLFFLFTGEENLSQLRKKQCYLPCVFMKG